LPSIKFVNKELELDGQKVWSFCHNNYLIEITNDLKLSTKIFLVFHELVHAFFYALNIPDEFDQIFDRIDSKLDGLIYR